MRQDALLCPNLNHRRTDAPVRYCPSCGGVVNVKMTSVPCLSASHDVRRRGGSIFCVDCGERLAKALAGR